MKPKWWHTNDKAAKTPDWRPVDLTCPCCRSNLVGDVSKRIVVIRYEAQCDNCGTSVAAESKQPLPSPDVYRAQKRIDHTEFDDIPF